MRRENLENGVQTLRLIEREGRGGGGGRWWIKNAYFTSQVQLLTIVCQKPFQQATLRR